MVNNKPITFVLQPDDLAYSGRNLDHTGQIVLTHLCHNFIHTFLVGVSTACARQTGVPMGCLVSSEKQHPSAL